MDEMKIQKRKDRRFAKEKLIQEHGRRCAYCGCEITENELCEVDAYLPLRTHPECDNYDNYILACRRCNCIKAAKEPIDKNGKILILHPYKEQYWKEMEVEESGMLHGKTAAGKSTIELLQLNRPELVTYRNSNIAAFIERMNDGGSAFDAYKKSVEHIRKLALIDVRSTELKNYYYRLLYANVITSMEAYLSKKIITLVLNNNVVFWNFVEKFEWNNEKVEISRIKQVYDEMDIRVQTALAGLMYHNLPKIKHIYKKILDVSILSEKEDMAFLCKAVNIRHDIVHRNGRKNGKNTVDEYRDITLEQIVELIVYVEKLVDSIEKQVSCKWEE